MNEQLVKFAVIALSCLGLFELLVHLNPLPAEVPADQALMFIAGLLIAYGPAMWLLACLLYLILDVK